MLNQIKNTFLSYTYSKIKNKKILLVCSGGLTAIYYDCLFKKVLHQEIDITTFTEMDEIGYRYDLILLVEQIAYLLPTLKEKYGDKINII